MELFDNKQKIACNNAVTDCHFELKTYTKGIIVHNSNANINYLIYCQSGHVRISSTLFHDEILCAGEIMFVPRQSDYSGTVLSDVTLLIHKFNNTICSTEKCILAQLYSHRRIENKIYCCKLSACETICHLTEGIVKYIADRTHNEHLWRMKHMELMWIFTNYYSIEELRTFFHPMTDERVPFKSLVLTHYRKANHTEELAELCGYGVHTFRRIFKNEFGIPVYRWLIQKRAELIKYRLSMPFIPLSDIIEEFNFSSPQQFNSFCKQYLGNTPGNLKKIIQDNAEDVLR